MSKGLGITLAVVAVLLLVVFMVFGSYVSAKNQMVSLDQVVKTKWSDVDVQLERRADLIPNLVATVKGFTKEESSVFTEIAKARDGLMNAQTPADKIAANGQLDNALAKVLVLTENYPTTALQRSVHALAGRAVRHREPYCGGAQALQSGAAGLQHVHPAVPEQHLGALCRLPGE